MTSSHFIARIAATAITALSVLSLPAIASANMVTPRPDLIGSYGDTALGESVVTGSYQQIYPSSSFYVTEPLEILQIRLRPHSVGSFSIELSNVEIRLSETDVRAQAISGVFADNGGSDPTVVYSGALVLHSGGISGQPARDFNLVVDLDEAYNYDPADGNLLLEWRNLGDVESSGASPNFDAISTRFGSVVSAAGSADDGAVITGGIATRFADGVIPEPSGALLFALGALVTLRPRQRK